MKNKFPKSITLTLLLILLNNSYSWAEALKGGPSDSEEKVLYFVLLSMILLVGVTGALFFAMVAKSICKKEKNGYYYYLFTTLIILLIIALMFRQSALILIVMISVLSSLGMLIYKLNPIEMNIKVCFFKSLIITLISAAISVFIVIGTFF